MLVQRVDGPTRADRVIEGNGMPAIVTLTLNPAVDSSCSVDRVVAEHKLRCSQPEFDPGGAVSRWRGSFANWAVPPKPSGPAATRWVSSWCNFSIVQEAVRFGVAAGAATVTGTKLCRREDVERLSRQMATSWGGRTNAPRQGWPGVPLVGGPEVRTPFTRIAHRCVAD
jgi:hypothetical protein